MKNKTILRSMAMTIFASFLILSCSKQQMNTQDTALSYELPNDIAKHVIQEHGLLKFENKESFDFAFQILESENKRHSDLLKEYCIALTCQSLEYKEILKANEFAVYEAFEESLGFKSLRAKIAIDEEVWLNNRELDLANDPDNHCIVGNEMRALFNENGEIMIGNSIYVVGDNWLVYEITNGSFEILEILRSVGYEGQEINHVIIHNQESNLKYDCKKNKDKIEYINYIVGYQAKCRITITNALFWHFCKAELTNYKFNTSTGNWDKEPATLKVKIVGWARGNDCTGNYYIIDENEETNVKTIDAKQSYGVTLKVRNGDVSSDHWVNGSHITTLVLEW